MQATTSILNAIINTEALAKSAMVVGAANAHRSYLADFHFADVSAVVVSCSGDVSCCHSPTYSLKPMSVNSDDSMQGQFGFKQSAIGQATKTHLPRQSMRSWQERRHQLPSALWATLILNRALCG